MSIATRIQAIEEHISDAYDSLSKFGVTAPSNKNIENIASLVNEIYDNTPKTNYASGTDLTLENTRVGKIDFKDTDNIEKIGLGATNQYTATGKNKLSLTMETRTAGGITITKNNDNSYKISGTSANLLLFGSNDTQTLTANTTYTLGITNGNNNVQLSLRTPDGNTQYVKTEGTATYATFTPTTDIEVKLYVRIPSGVTVNETIFPMVVEGSTIGTYEPYVGGIAVPNPDNPQDIYIVKGNQNIVIKGKNLLNLQNGTYTSNGITANVNNGIIILNGTAGTGNSYINIPYSQTIEPKIEYTLSLNNDFTTSNTSDGLRLSTNDNTRGSFTALNRTKTFTFQNALASNQITIRLMEGSTINNGTLMPQLEKGNTATSYVPHQENNYEINLSSKNLFDKDNSNLIMDNMYINASGYKLQAANGMKTICISCEPNTTYVVSKIASARFVIGTASDKTAGTSMTVGRNTTTATELTLTSGANDKYLFVFYYHGSADTLTEETIRNSIQIEVGSTATSYTPYFNIELYKIENNQDYIYKTSGKNLFDSEKYLENASISYNTIVSANKNNLFYIPVQYGRNYTISFVDKGVSGNILYGFSNDKPVIGGACTYNLLDITQLNKHTFTPVSANNKYLCIRLNVVNTNQYKAMANIQVEVGDVATTYESCGKDDWYWHKENYKIKLSSTNQTWIRTTTNTSDIARYRTDDYIDIIKKVSSATVIGNILCNYYNPQIAGTAGSYGGNQGIAIDNLGAIFINDNTYSQDFAGWKEWLDSVDCYICFSLATPIETQITDTTLISQLNAWYNAQSMDDTTYITVDGNLPIQLKLKALKK